MGSRLNTLTEMSRTPSTDAAYAARADRLFAEFGEPVADGVAFAHWLEGRIAGLRTPSARLYRAACAAALDQRGLISAGRVVREIQLPSGNSGHPLRTSAMKRKSLPPDLRDALIAALRSESTPSCDLAADWLMAGYLTGCRPSEIPGLQILEDGPRMVLQARNAKSTNGRSHGEVRTLILEDVEPAQREALHRLLAQASQAEQTGEPWSRTYQRARMALQRIAASIQRRHDYKPSLYSARHQFAADLKKANLPPAEIAALMGHAVDDTATVHYGRRQYGASRGAVKAAPEEVARVRSGGPGSRPTAAESSQPLQATGPKEAGSLLE